MKVIRCSFFLSFAGTEICHRAGSPAVMEFLPEGFADGGVF